MKKKVYKGNDIQDKLVETYMVRIVELDLPNLLEINLWNFSLLVIMSYFGIFRLVLLLEGRDKQTWWSFPHLHVTNKKNKMMN